MKSLYYVANLSRVYKQAVNALIKGLTPSKQLAEELDKISHRIYTEGFIDGFDASLTQNYDSSSYIRKYQFLGTIERVDGRNVYIDVRSKFSQKEEIEIIFPDPADDLTLEVAEIWDENDQLISFTKPNTTVKMELPVELQTTGILRKKI